MHLAFSDSHHAEGNSQLILHLWCLLVILTVALEQALGWHWSRHWGGMFEIHMPGSLNEVFDSSKTVRGAVTIYRAVST